MHRPRHQARQRRDHARHSGTSVRKRSGSRRSGIVRIGAGSKAGDILVGKITPKGETQLSPEESCCVRSSVKRPAMFAIARCGFRLVFRASSFPPACLHARGPKDERAKDIEDAEEKLITDRVTR